MQSVRFGAAGPSPDPKATTMILVTGAAGLNGTALVRTLSAKGIAVRALVRNAAKAAPLAALPNVEIVVADMARPETLSAALAGIDRAMLNSSADPAMLEVQLSFIAAAAKAGVKHVVKLSGIMPELDSPFRFARMHGEIEKRLEASGSFNAMVSHRVRVSKREEVDKELISWLKQAYDAA